MPKYPGIWSFVLLEGWTNTWDFARSRWALLVLGKSRVVFCTPVVMTWTRSSDYYMGFAQRHRIEGEGGVKAYVAGGKWSSAHDGR